MIRGSKMEGDTSSLRCQMWAQKSRFLAQTDRDRERERERRIGGAQIVSVGLDHNSSWAALCWPTDGTKFELRIETKRLIMLPNSIAGCNCKPPNYCPLRPVGGTLRILNDRASSNGDDKSETGRKSNRNDGEDATISMAKRRIIMIITAIATLPNAYVTRASKGETETTTDGG